MARKAGEALMLSLDIQKTLGSFNLDVQLNAPGGITAIYGPSGSGKTSLINAVAGLIDPNSGSIDLHGKSLFANGKSLAPAQRNIGYVFQDARLFPHMNVLQNLRYGGQKDEAKIIELLALGNLLQRRPKDLSGGEKQRVAVGRALMRGPDLLLMDEPLSALDDHLKAEILPFFEELRDEVHLPILYVTHSMSEVARLATTLALINNGKILRAGPVEEVLSDPEAVPLIGVRAAGALLSVKIEAIDNADHLTTLAFDGGKLVLPGLLGPIDKPMRIRVAAQDVILAREEPKDISALNILPVTVTQMTKGKGPGVAVGLKCGNTPLLARITARSARDLDLKEGTQIYAILKATAVAPSDVGGKRR